jgi:hypothetical protein
MGEGGPTRSVGSGEGPACVASPVIALPKAQESGWSTAGRDPLACSEGPPRQRSVTQGTAAPYSFGRTLPRDDYLLRDDRDDRDDWGRHVIQHEVNHDAADTNEHPDGPNPSGESSVASVLSLESSRRNDHDEGGVHGSQDDVRDKDGKIKGTRPIMVGIRD